MGPSFPRGRAFPVEIAASPPDRNQLTPARHDRFPCRYARLDSRKAPAAVARAEQWAGRPGLPEPWNRRHRRVAVANSLLLPRLCQDGEVHPYAASCFTACWPTGSNGVGEFRKDIKNFDRSGDVYEMKMGRQNTPRKLGHSYTPGTGFPQTYGHAVAIAPRVRVNLSLRETYASGECAERLFAVHYTFCRLPRRPNGKSRDRCRL